MLKCSFLSFFHKGNARLLVVLSTASNFGTWKIIFFQTRHDSEKIKVWGRQKDRWFPYFAAGFYALPTLSTPVRRIVYGSISPWDICGYSSTKVPNPKGKIMLFWQKFALFKSNFQGILLLKRATNAWPWLWHLWNFQKWININQISPCELFGLAKLTHK